jgi:hypothetical protein
MTRPRLRGGLGLRAAQALATMPQDRRAGNVTLDGEAGYHAKLFSELRALSGAKGDGGGEAAAQPVPPT